MAGKKKGNGYSKSPAAVKARLYREQRQQKQTELPVSHAVMRKGRPRNKPGRAVSISIQMDHSGIKESVRRLVAGSKNVNSQSAIDTMLGYAKGVATSLQEMVADLNEARRFFATQSEGDAPDAEIEEATDGSVLGDNDKATANPQENFPLDEASPSQKPEIDSINAKSVFPGANASL